MSRCGSLFAPIRIDTLEAHQNVLLEDAHTIDRIAAAETARILSRSLDRLPSKLRGTLELRIVAGSAIDETARHPACPASS